jgi:hypothetical protein
MLNKTTSTMKLLGQAAARLTKTTSTMKSLGQAAASKSRIFWSGLVSAIIAGFESAVWAIVNNRWVRL